MCNPTCYFIFSINCIYTEINAWFHSTYSTSAYGYVHGFKDVVDPRSLERVQIAWNMRSWTCIFVLFHIFVLCIIIAECTPCIITIIYDGSFYFETSYTSYISETNNGGRDKCLNVERNADVVPHCDTTFMVFVHIYRHVDFLKVFMI